MAAYTRSVRDEKANANNAFAFDNFITSLADNIDPNANGNSLIWKPTPGPQTQAFNTLAMETFYGGSAGGGKANACSSKVSTPLGWKRMGDIKVGDVISTVDGGTTKVIGVYPQGVQDIYKVSFADGATTFVTADHLWNYWTSSSKQKLIKTFPVMASGRIQYTEIAPERYGYLVGTTSDLAKSLDRQKTNSKKRSPIIPLADPVFYSTSNRNQSDVNHWIHPYVLGVLLGDGCITGTHKYPEFASMDSEIVDKVISIYDNTFSIGNISYRIESNELVQSLKYFNLWGTYSDTKFIPDVYKVSSIRERFKLIRGLFDTDGYVDSRGHVSYTSVSKQLILDIQEIVRSLGYKATLTSKIGKYRDKLTAEIVECKLAYTLTINGRNTKELFRLSRKKDRCVDEFNGGFSEIGRRLVSIEFSHREEAQCIQVEDASSLYLTDDFIVTHNSDLLLGWALTRGVKSIIFRREYPQLKQIIDRSKEVLATSPATYNGQSYVWTNIPGGRMLEFGSIPHEESVNKYMGRPHDFIGFDEVSNILESQYIFLTTWNRTEIKGLRTRIISAGNPPTNVEGEWVIRRWAPWLDPQYGRPALPGEIRWFANLTGKEEEVEDGTPIKRTRLVKGVDKEETIYPTSRTFIAASVEDNPHYGDDYKARLQALPEELKSKFLDGDFGLSFKDDPWQVIPSDWVKMGRRRYDELKAADKLRDLENVNPAYGVDPAEAGEDSTAMCKLTINVVQSIIYSTEPDSMKVADWIVRNMIGHRGAPIAIDANGVGAGIHYRLKQMELKSLGIKSQSKTELRDRTGNMKFLNLRAYMWWMIRDALDPNGTIKLALPPDIRLERELITPRWELTESGLVQVEKRESIHARLGRSPDAASALQLALFVSHVRRPGLRMV